jgi:hypothetical protein
LQIFAAVTAPAASDHLDFYGKKFLIRCACFVLSVAYLFYAFTISFMQCLVRVTSYVLANGVYLAASYGLANGVYLAADFSTAVDSLPTPPSARATWDFAALLHSLVACSGRALVVLCSSCSGTRCPAPLTPTVLVTPDPDS